MAKCNQPSSQKGDLRDLTNLPARDFEIHFQNWMQQDEVARALQAKLRKDLVMAFNKTILGKQILAQTTTSTSAAGMPSRFTLSPLVLALNTLVAEFLYAQNCHFSLSVFCTEVPFCNTLPDFESMRNFRFETKEITAIIEAMFPTTVSSDKTFALQIAKDYAKTPKASLLLLLLKSVVHRMIPKSLTHSSPTQTKKVTSSVKEASPQKLKTNGSLLIEADNNDQLRQLNRYLLMLAKKVSAMVEIFDSSHNSKGNTSNTLLRPRLKLSSRRRKYENLNRSLERVTENLKHLTRAKKQNKNITPIVNAINTLSQQFAKCSAKMEPPKSPMKDSKCENKNGITTTQKAIIAASVQPIDYGKWVHDMRNTENGRKFLDKIEVSMKKTLMRKKEQLRIDMEEKLKLHKELLKVHYRQKMAEELTKYGAGDCRSEEHRHSDSIAARLEKLEEHQSKQNSGQMDVEEPHPPKVETSGEEQMSYKDEIKQNEESSNQLGNVLKNSVYPCLQGNHCPHKKITKLAKNMVSQSRKVDNIVMVAKERIQQLETESEQVEKNFREYLERQRLEKQLTRETAKGIWENYVQERDKLRSRYGLDTTNDDAMTSCRKRFGDLEKFSQLPIFENEINPDNLKEPGTSIQKGTEIDQEDLMPELLVETGKKPHNFKNIILEAKEKFFADVATDRRAKEKLLALINPILPNGAKGNGFCEMDAYFINANYSALESQQNLSECNRAKLKAGSFVDDSRALPGVEGRSLRKPLRQLIPVQSVKKKSATESLPLSTLEDVNAKTIFRNVNYYESIVNIEAKKGSKEEEEAICGEDGQTELMDKGDSTEIAPKVPRTVEDSLAKMRRLFTEPLVSQTNTKLLEHHNKVTDQVATIQSYTSHSDYVEGMQPLCSNTGSFKSAIDQELPESLPAIPATQQNVPAWSKRQPKTDQKDNVTHRNNMKDHMAHIFQMITSTISSSPRSSMSESAAEEAISTGARSDSRTESNGDYKNSKSRDKTNHF